MSILNDIPVPPKIKKINLEFVEMKGIHLTTENLVENGEILGLVLGAYLMIAEGIFKNHKCPDGKECPLETFHKPILNNIRAAVATAQNFPL